MKSIDKKSLEKIGLLVGVIIVLIGIIVFLIRPTIIGYTTYKQLIESEYSLEDYGKNINELEKDLIGYQANLSACNLFSDKISGEFVRSAEQFSECTDELNDLKIQLSLLEDEYSDGKKELEEELNSKNKKINELESGYSELAKNLANNLCCKKKVDNQNINYYIIENNMIICTEEGELEVSC